MPARRPRKRPAPASVVRLAEATGASPRGWEAAVTAAVRSSEVSDPIGVEVQRMWAEWNGRRMTRYFATVRVAYRQPLKPTTR